MTNDWGISAMRRRLLSCCLIFASTVLASRAHAGPAEDRAAADALFREGRSLVKQGKITEACPRLEASQKIDPAVGTLLALGDCYELEGRTASAWSTFNDALALARQRDDTKRGDEAARRGSLLEPKLSKLTIEVAQENRVAGLEVRRNGKALDAVLFGSAVPVDPGEQVIEVTAPGKQAWSTKAVIEAKPGVTMVRIPVLEAVAPPEPVKTEPSPPDPPKTEPPPDPPKASPPEPAKTAPSSTSATLVPEPALAITDRPASSWSTQKTVGLVVGGVGILGIVGGSINGAIALEEMRQIREQNLCTNDDPPRCTPQGFSNQQDANAFATASNVLFAVGGAALVGGIVIFATAPKGKAPKANAAQATVEPMAGPGLAGLSLRGAF